MSSPADRLSRVITSAPSNRTAATVASDREGERWEPIIPDHVPHFETPPPMLPVPRGASSLVGQRFGRLTVIGYYRRHPKKGSQWACRCSCGRYEVRRTGALVDFVDPDGRDLMCSRCSRLESVKWRYENLPPRDFKGNGAAGATETES